MDDIKIVDESGDRKYFTQVPNIIVNHSTAYEQSLYLVMKRIAGENGTCFASLNYLSGKMGVAKRTISKTIEKLLKRKWIKELEPKQVNGGFVRQFLIVDLWKLNIEEYESEVIKVEPTYPPVEPTCTEGGTHVHTKKNYIIRTINKNTATDKSVATPNDSKKRRDDEPMNLEDFISYTENSPQRHIHVIGAYAAEKKFPLTTYGQWQTIIRRNVRPAKYLSVFSDEQISGAFKKLKEAKYLTDWTLETLLKFIEH